MEKYNICKLWIWFWTLVSTCMEPKLSAWNSNAIWMGVFSWAKQCAYIFLYIFLTTMVAEKHSQTSHRYFQLVWQLAKKWSCGHKYKFSGTQMYEWMLSNIEVVWFVVVKLNSQLKFSSAVRLSFLSLIQVHDSFIENHSINFFDMLSHFHDGTMIGNISIS